MCETERQAIMELIEFDRFVEQDDCDKYNMLQQSACEIRALENKNQQLKEVIEEAKENINELIEHYKRLLNAKFNQEISVFVDNTHKNMFISNVISSLEVMKIYILDKVGETDE